MEALLNANILKDVELLLYKNYAINADGKEV
jgi:hypothetical protein